jgi:hypothetical protein
MSEEARVELTGDTTKLDRKVEESARKQTQLAQITAQEMETINSAINNKALRDFDRVGAAASRSTEAVGRPMVKLKEEMRLFGGVSMRVGAGITTALVVATTAAKALISELARVKDEKAALGEKVGNQTFSNATALASSRIAEVDKVIAAAKTAGGPVKQEEVDQFVSKLADSKLSMSGDRGAELVKTFALHAPVLGDGAPLLAAQALRPGEAGQSLADSVVSFRQRTGKELNLDDIREKDKAIIAAQEKFNVASTGIKEADRSGSMSTLHSAQKQLAAAREELTKLQTERLDFFNLSAPEPGISQRRLTELGPEAMRVAGLKSRIRREEIADNEGGAEERALIEQVRKIDERQRKRFVDDIVYRGGYAGWMASSLNYTGIDSLTSKVSSVVSDATGGVSNRDKNAQIGATAIANDVVQAINAQTNLLRPRVELRPDAHKEP